MNLLIEIVGFHGYGENAERFLESLERIPGIAEWHVLAVQALHLFYERKRRRVGLIGSSSGHSCFCSSIQPGAVSGTTWLGLTEIIVFGSNVIGEDAQCIAVFNRIERRQSLNRLAHVLVSHFSLAALSDQQKRETVTVERIKLDAAAFF